MKKITKNIITFLLFVGFLLSIVRPVRAVNLHLEPDFSQHNIGDIFIVGIRLDTDYCINAGQIELIYPTQLLKGRDFSTGSSIFEFWPEEPEIDNERGRIYFSGGTPDGFCGNGSAILGEVVFEAEETLRKFTEKIIISDYKILLDDGLGTEAEVEKEDAYFVVLPNRSSIPSDPWRERLQEDRTSPESFDPEIRRDPSISDGKYVVVFSTVDRQTGLDYYKVSETRRVGFIEVGEKQWKRAESPYLLEDQSLASIIRVKAVDRAGNARVEEIHPPYGIWDYGPWVGVIVIIFTIIYFKARRKRKDLNIEWS